MFIEFLVHERVLHQSLTVIEDAVNLYGCDVLSERSKLAFLNLAHLAFRIAYIHVDTLYSEETVGYCRTCVARCGNENIHGLAIVGRFT